MKTTVIDLTTGREITITNTLTPEREKALSTVKYNLEEQSFYYTEQVDAEMKEARGR